MSVFSILTAGIACLATVSAYHAPVGDSPSGNPITLPGSGSVLPVGQDYTIEWTPTTNGTVSLVLLKGPANNLAVVGAIAESIPNNGSYTWMPSSDLTAGPTASTGYGIQLIVDATGQYQYTTQFGISNDHWQNGGWGSASWSSSWPASATSWGSDSLTAYSSTTWSDASSTTATDSSSTESASATTSWADITTAPAMTTTAVTMATSTVSAKVSASSKTPSTTTSAPVATSTGGAASLKASVMGLVAVAAAAVFAF